MTWVDASRNSHLRSELVQSGVVVRLARVHVVHKALAHTDLVPVLIKALHEVLCVVAAGVGLLLHLLLLLLGLHLGRSLHLTLGAAVVSVTTSAHRIVGSFSSSSHTGTHAQSSNDSAAKATTTTHGAGSTLGCGVMVVMNLLLGGRRGASTGARWR